MMPAVTRHSIGRRVAARFAAPSGAIAAHALYWLACLWRRVLRRTTFVAITGSHGKTTARELLAAALATRGPTLRSRDNTNSGLPLTRNLLRVRPGHRYAVIEVGVGAPGEMRRLARLVAPDVAVVLPVRPAHTTNFADRAAHAAEKAELLAALRPGGIAVLAADDELVRAMAPRVRGRVVQAGSSPGLDVWSEHASGRWPARLELAVRTREGERCVVRTRLVGTHWQEAVTAAIAAARALGVTLPDAGDAVAGVDPFPSRLEPVSLPCGAVVLRDDYDGSFVTFEAAMRVLEESRAARRVAVISDVSDFGNARKRKRLEHLGAAAARAADLAVFVGAGAAHGRAGAVAAGLAPEHARAFAGLEEAAAFLRRTLGAGDLVLLKGRTSDHVARLFLAQLGTVRCWRPSCDRRIACDVCPELGLAAADRAPSAVVPPHPPARALD